MRSGNFPRNKNRKRIEALDRIKKKVEDGQYVGNKTDRATYLAYATAQITILESRITHG
jgi:hypothetical protein